MAIPKTPTSSSLTIVLITCAIVYLIGATMVGSAVSNLFVVGTELNLIRLHDDYYSPITSVFNSSNWRNVLNGSLIVISLIVVATFASVRVNSTKQLDQLSSRNNYLVHAVLSFLYIFSLILSVLTIHFCYSLLMFTIRTIALLVWS